MPSAPPLRQVFISHSSRDAAIAEVVREALESAGIGCWIAPRDIAPGTDWSEALVAGLDECRLTVLIFSANSGASVQVRREIQYTFENGKTVVPFRIEDVRPTGAFAYYLSPVHWLNALEPPLDAHLPGLVAYVHSLLTGAEVSNEVHLAPAPISATAVDDPETSPAAVPGRLPEPLGPFIGRTAEVAAWADLLASGTDRVLTLLAFGGMGKTRSALEVARRAGTHFPGGAWWVELDTATDAPGLIERIAAVLSVTLDPQSAQAPDEQVARRIQQASAPLLLVLDNTEQIPDVGRPVSTLLQAAPNLTCLVTSRRALEIAGERLIEVGPLPQEDAEALFIEKARARQSDFNRTPENAADIADLVRRLDGMPLAIELAAARVGALTPRDILARLVDRYKLLQTRASHLPERQRALTGAVEWSVELLTEPDRDLFARLSVFAGGFYLDAAEAVCDDGDSDIDVYEGIHELRRHSLLRGETELQAQRVRFSYLSFLREYAARRLTGQEGGAVGQAMRARHANHYAAFAEARAKAMRTAGETGALADLWRELDNLRAALDFAEECGDDALLVRLALAAEPALHRRGYWPELEARLNAALAAGDRLPEDAASNRLRAMLRARLASLDHDQGDTEAAQQWAEDALARYEALEDTAGVAEMRNLLGLLALAARDFDAASDHFESSLAMRHPNDHAGCSLPMYNLAWLASLTGDQEEARRRYQESLERQRKAGDRRLQARTLGNLGAVAYRCGAYDEADRLYREGLILHRELGDQEGIATTLYNLAELAEQAGDYPHAVALLVHAERLLREIGSALSEAPGEAIARLSGQMSVKAFAAAKEIALCSEWEALC